MTKDEVLKMAIEALEDYPYEHRTAKMDDALQACKEALEQPSVAELNGEYLRDTYVEGLSQPAQEPIHNCPNCNSLFTKEIHSIPAPSWQGLSDDEVDAVWFEVVKENNFEGAGKYFARAIEQALKEKNT
jgi:hypothetical protein